MWTTMERCASIDVGVSVTFVLLSVGTVASSPGGVAPNTASLKKEM